MDYIRQKASRRVVDEPDARGPPPPPAPPQTAKSIHPVEYHQPPPPPPAARPFPTHATHLHPGPPHPSQPHPYPHPHPQRVPAYNPPSPAPPPKPAAYLGVWTWPATPFPYPFTAKDAAREREQELRATLLFPSGCLPSPRPKHPRVWGGGLHPQAPPRRVYTDDSDVLACAVHAGFVGWSTLAQAKADGSDLKVDVGVV
ncbi:hypothetical protein OF83DRAFT_1058964, partial [Amylostereum chailletii]